MAIGWSAAAMVGSAVVGGYASNKAAKKSAKAQERATAQQMEPYQLKAPYLSDMYGNVEKGSERAINAGIYDGPTYATMDDRTAQGLDFQYNNALNNAELANGIMGQTGGFAGNSADLYGLASQDHLQGAMDYASGPRLDNMATAAMRNDYRTLTESTLPGIDQKASATGNMNSSRAGIADAVAMRGYDDRAADVRSDIQSGLMDDYLQQQQNQFTNMTNANNNMASYFGDGYGFQSGVAGDLINSGIGYQQEEQNIYNDMATNYENSRMDEMGILSQQANIMGDTPTVGRVTPNLYDSSTAGLTGAMSGGMAAWEMMGKPNLFSGGTAAPPAPVYQADPFTGAQSQVFHSPVTPTMTGGL